MKIVRALFAVTLICFSASFSQTLVVTTEKDTVDPADGLLSLREAIESADATSGAQSITFDATHFHADSNRVISLRSPLRILDNAGLTINASNVSVSIVRDTALADSVRFDAIVIKGGNTTVSGLTIQGMKGAGIRIDTGSVGMNAIGPGNRITNCEEAGIKIINSSNNTVRMNEIRECGLLSEDGVMVTDTSGFTTIEENSVWKNSWGGIGVFHSHHTTVSKNIVTQNGAWGITINGGDGNNTIQHNIVAGNNYDGISLSGGNNKTNVISHNSIGDSTATLTFPTSPTIGFGIEGTHHKQRSSPGVSILQIQLNARLQANAAKAIRVRPKRMQNPIREGKSPAGMPLRLEGTARASVADHRSNGGSGISLYGVSETVIENNLIYGSGDDGIYIAGTYEGDLPVRPDHITIRNNRVERSYDSHIEFYEVRNLTVSQNVFRFSQYGLYGSGGYQGGSGYAIGGTRQTMQEGGGIQIHENHLSIGDDGEAVYIFDAYAANIERNVVSNFYYGGVNLYNVRSVRVIGNEFSTIGYYESISAYNADSVWVKTNSIRGADGGIYVSGVYVSGGESRLTSTGRQSTYYGYAEITGNTLQAVDYESIDVYSLEKAIISENRIDGSEDTGIEFGYLDSAWVQGNEVVNTEDEGFYGYEVGTLYFTDNRGLGQYDDNAAYFYYISNASIHRNMFADGYDGVYIYGVDTLWASENKFLSSRDDGFTVDYCKFGRVWMNDSYGHGGAGFRAYSSDSLLFEQNNATGNAYAGFSMWHNNRVTLRNNTMLENGGAGIESYYDTVLVIENNFVALNRYGFYVYNTTDSSRAIRNTFFKNRYGSAYYGQIQSFNATENYWGHASGPRNTTNEDGSNQTNDGAGDDVSEYVLFTPFLTSPPYLSEARPAITHLLPNYSPRTGGGLVSLRGRQILPGATVFFGSDTVKGVVHVSSDHLAFNAPPGRGGPVDVIVKNLNGKADTLGQGFVYENAAPFGFTLVGPSNTTIASAHPKFVWTRAVDPDGDAVEYKLLYSRFESFEDSLYVTGITDTTYTLFGDTLEPDRQFYWRVIASDTREGYTLSAIHQFRTGSLLSTEGAEYVPTTFAISQNFPNPFNPSTTIRFQIPERASVLLKVYDMLGREVATLVNEEKNPGFFTVSWNGRNQYGQPVASGVYFYRMVAAKSSNQANSFSGIRRMLLLK